MHANFEGFVGAIAAANKEITRIKANEMRRFGLKGTDVMVLYHLDNATQEITAAELSRRIGVDRAVVSRSLAGLVRKGFVCGPEGAGRYRAPIRLTEEGARVTSEVDKIIEQMVLCAVEGVSPEDRATMMASLTSIVNNLQGMSKE